MAQHFGSLQEAHLEGAWLTIGSFDGVHRGHQAILRRLVTGAHDHHSPAVVLTFHPHPGAVLGKRQGPFYLTTPAERAHLLANMGVDVVITHPFTRELAAMTAREFVSLLNEHLGLQHLLVGPDFALGHGREGDIPRLTELGAELGYHLDVLQPVLQDGQVISSSQIRSLLAEGDVDGAAHLLGRPFSLTGQVVHGDGRGRGLGIPTANLDVWPERVAPKPGVYVCRAHIGEHLYGAVTNIGVRPTFENQPASPRVEAHLLEFDGDLYEQSVELDFLARLRDEQRFPNVDALLAQIAKDIALARETLLIQPPDPKL